MKRDVVVGVVSGVISGAVLSGAAVLIDKFPDLVADYGAWVTLGILVGFPLAGGGELALIVSVVKHILDDDSPNTYWAWSDLVPDYPHPGLPAPTEK